MEERRAFRQHWLMALVLPGAPWLVLLAATGAGAFHLAGRRGSGLLLIPATIAAFKCVWLCLQWLAYTAIVEEGTHELVVRRGVVNIREDRVPLSRVTGTSCERPWWATLFRLDVATIVVETFGKAYPLPYIDGCSGLWRALQGMAQTGVAWVRRTEVQ